MIESTSSSASHLRGEERTSRLGRRWRPVAFHALVIAPALIAALVESPPLITLGLGGALVMLGYPALAAMEGRRASLVISPLSFYFAWSSVGLGISPIWKALEIAGGVVRFPFSAAEIEAADLASGYALFLLGVLIFHAGMTATRPVRLDEEASPDRPFPARGFALLWAAGVGASISYELGVDASWSAATGLIAPASRAALIGFLLHAVQKGRIGIGLFTFVGVATALEVVLGFASGSKAFVMTAFEPIVWALLFRRSLRWMLVPLLPVFAAVYLLGVYPIVMDARLLDPIAGERFLGRVGRVIDGESPAYSYVYSASFTDFLDRQFEPTPLGYLVGVVREQGLRGGETLAYVGYALVPRLFWPEKPDVTRGQWFDAMVRGDQIQSSLGQTAQGELYWNFGVLGLSLGMAIIGAMVGVLWRLAGDRPELSPIKMLLYLSLTTGTVSMAEAGTAAVSLVIRFLVFAPAIWIERQTETRRRRILGAPGATVPR